MGRARGINATQTIAFETTYGTSPVSGGKRVPFVSSTLGEERPLIEDDQLGLGREGTDPQYDVGTNDGDIVVPIDNRAFGHWLKLVFGAPTTSGSGPYTHVFTSGATTLPSLSIEYAHPEVPSYHMNFGARANQLRYAMSRGGMLNATIGIVAKGEKSPTTSSAITSSAEAASTRFAQAVGYIKKAGVTLGSIMSSDFTYSNSLEKVDTIQPDGRIEDADPGKAMTSGSIVTRFASLDLLTAATDGTPVDLEFGWVNGAHSLKFVVQRVFLPRVKRPISGPGGVQATFNWQASGASGAQCVATLIGPASTYA